MRLWLALLLPALPNPSLQRAAVLVSLLMAKDAITAVAIITHVTVQVFLQALILEDELIMMFLVL